MVCIHPRLLDSFWVKQHFTGYIVILYSISRILENKPNKTTYLEFWNIYVEKWKGKKNHSKKENNIVGMFLRRKTPFSTVLEFLLI